MRFQIFVFALLFVASLVSCCPDEGQDYIGTKDCKHVADDWKGCQKFCADHDPCHYWTWNKDTNACCSMLKKNFKGTTKQEGIVSGNWACKKN